MAVNLTMEQRFDRGFLYFNSGVPSTLEKVNLGIHQASCNYDSALPRDYQTIPQDCQVFRRDISNTSDVQPFPQEPAESYTPRSGSRCENTFPSLTRKPDFHRLTNPKRSRTVFQPRQIRRLQYEFEREMYMVGIKRQNLSKELDLSEKQIKIWFQNRRMKQKREHNRRRRRSFGNLRNICAAEFGLEKLRISDSISTNNTQMLI